MKDTGKIEEHFVGVHLTDEQLKSAIKLAKEKKLSEDDIEELASFPIPVQKHTCPSTIISDIVQIICETDGNSTLAAFKIIESLSADGMISVDGKPLLKYCEAMNDESRG